MLLAALLALAAGPAWGQFQLYLVNGDIVQQIVNTYGLGNVAPGTPVAVSLQITNISSAPALLDLLTVTGAGFSVPAADTPALPVTLGPQQSVDFTVVFQATSPGTYSAAVNSVGISVTLTATVPVELTYQWVTGTGAVELLSAGPVTFGTVPVGQSPAIEILLYNYTSATLAVPSVSVGGSGFSLLSQPPAGTTVSPSASAALEVQFTPTAAGTSTGTLTIGGQSFTLTGTGVIAPLPAPSIALTLPEPDSDEQGTLAVNLSAVPQAPAAGTATLTFVPIASIPNASDPAIAFATGGQSVTFNVFIGQAQAVFGSANSIPFQTGTTAGTLTVTVELGANTVEQSIVILPAVVGLTAVQGVRSNSSVEVDLTGFDNTRTAGGLTFTFFDANGNELAAPIQADGSSDFAAYFQSSAGGTFELKAVFPVTGDTSQIASFQAVVANSAGNVTTARTSF
jgi:hypothetical protein